MKSGERLKDGFCFFSIFFLMAVSIPAAFAADEPYPNRPINVILNMAPGSLMDNHARILGERLAELLGQPFLRIHKPGGGRVPRCIFCSEVQAGRLYLTHRDLHHKHPDSTRQES